MSFHQITDKENGFFEYKVIIQNTPICKLPVDLFFEILKNLDPVTVHQVCSFLCKQFKIILSNQTYNRVWRDLFCTHFPNKKTNDIEGSNLSYKLAYQKECLILSNIKNGIFASKRISNRYSVVLGADDRGRLLIRARDGIKIWDPISDRSTRISVTSNLWSVAAATVSNKRLYIGFNCGDVKIVDTETLQILNTLKTDLNSDSEVISLTIAEENLIVKYSDDRIEILNLKEIENPGIEYRKIVLQHRNSPNTRILSSLITPDGKYFLATDVKDSGCFIEIRDLMSGDVTALLKVDDMMPIISLACDNEILYGVTEHAGIKVFDLKSLKCVATLISDKMLLSNNSSYLTHPLFSVTIGDGVLYASDDKGLIKFDFINNHDIVIKEIAEQLEIAEHLEGANSKKIIQNAMERLEASNSKGIIQSVMERLEIVVQLEAANSTRIIQNAMERFSRMPHRIRNGVYQELYLLLKPEKHYWGWGENAFNDQDPLSSSPLEKSKAIQNYLGSLKSEKVNSHSQSSSSVEKSTAIQNNLVSFKNEDVDPPIVYPLLQCLKIDTDKDYSNQLLCRPDQLNDRGIFTLKDLLVICPPSLEIQELSVGLPSANTNPDFREQQVRANRNRLNLSALCHQMLNAITKMDQEKKNWGAILYYDGNEYWSELQQQLNQFNTQLNDIVKKCDRNPHAIIQAFSEDAFAGLAKQLNDLIRKFQEVDRKHRIVKLRAYIHQEDILQVWNSEKLQDLSISTLSDFQEKYPCSLRELLHMKEYIENHLS